MTERAGLFEKHSLQVKTRLMHGTRGVVRGLMNGEIQLGNLAAPTLLRANLGEGTDLAFLTAGAGESPGSTQPNMTSLSSTTTERKEPL